MESNLQVKKCPGVYMLKNIINGNFYIGHASNLRSRKSSHFTNMRHGWHKNKHVQNAANLYGADKFTFNVLEYCEKDKKILAQIETYYVKLLKPEYNIREVEESNLGLKKSAEDIEKTVSKLRGVPRSEEVKNKIRISLLGRKRPKEVMDRIANLLRGRPNIKNRKPIIQYDLQGNFIKEWAAIVEAGKFLNVHFSNISSACLGKRKSAYGFKWQFKKKII